MRLKFGARRMVVDTISVLESLFDERDRLIALTNFRDAIKKGSEINKEGDKRGTAFSFGDNKKRIKHPRKLIPYVITGAEVF